MKKPILFFAFAISLILVGSVLANNSTVTQDVEKFVKDVAQKKGVQQEEVKEVKQVDFEELPEQIKLENIDDTNLAIYELSMKNGDKPLYVITASNQQFKKTVKEFTRKMMLNFGSKSKFSESGFLETSTGVQNSKEKGYVMMRDGSITGLSTNLEITESKNNSTIEIVIYKNKKMIGFRNSFNAKKTGIQNDYDTISEDVLKFKAGDVISVAIVIPEGTSVRDITTLMEIGTEE